MRSPEETAEDFDLQYLPFRKYHTKRVKNLRGQSLMERFWFLYEHDGKFRLNTQLIVVIGCSFLFAIGIVTLSFFIL